ncbi:hypothetical protein LINPERHAP1_LOCUS15680 [Linum perenne]
MRWHKEKRNDDNDWLRHPAYSKDWKNFNKEFPWFDEDSRNVRLGLAINGFNPFGNMSVSYSMWPVILTPYNLPPWMCMKEQFLFMTLLIPGPSAPGKDIDIYMQPLIDELKELWLEGIQTYDVHTKSVFQLHAAVMWTINDFLAYGNLSSWSTKGYLACPVCNKDSPGESLKSKIGYLGHRRFLPINHRWRRDKKFNGKRETRLHPPFLCGDDLLEQLAQVPLRLPGKHPQIQNKRKRPSEELNWVKKSIFFTLPYERKLNLRHNLDVMHIEKNMCDNIIGTLLDAPGKTKDTIKARQDLEMMGIRKELHLVRREDGRYEMPHACYTMTKEERKLFCQFLKEVKFPDGYASNISRCSNAMEVHLPHEAILGGPVQYRWMYPIERYLSTLKGFVRNKAHPEGSIAESYVVNECLTFCAMYLDGIETSFNAPERNFDIETEDELSVFSSKVRMLGAPDYVQLTSNELNMMHWYVLSNCEEVQPYMEDHLNSIVEVDPSRKQEIHKSQFSEWFKIRMTSEWTFSQSERTLALHSLSCEPISSVTKYTGCIINGVRFHTKDREMRRKTQNSGIVVEGNHLDEIIDFYGVLVDIIELDYVRDKHIYLFQCDWYDVEKKKSRIVNDGAVTSIRVDRLWYSSDPFVLASQATQVFYINDPKLGSNWRVVQKFNHRHIFVGELENLNALDGDDDAYQDEELTNNASGMIGNDDGIELSLRREDVMPEVISSNLVTSQTVSQLPHRVVEQQQQTSDQQSNDEGYLESISDASEDEGDNASLYVSDDNT